jgi:ABC-type transport system involved in multi-copper enzyme maturation permease subunit
MNTILTLARLQILENIRRQVHLLTLFFGFLLLILPAYINTFSLGLDGFERVSKDFGLTLISYYGLAMAVYQGCTVIPKDIERKTIYPILSRPVSRVHYVCGQFVGIASVLGASLLVLGICLILSIGSLAHSLDFRMLLAIYSSYLECLLMAAACLCFSTFASPPLAGVMGAFVYIVGGLSEAFIKYILQEDRGSSGAAWVASHVRSLLPRFSLFQLKLAVVHDLPLDPLFLVSLLAYAASWIGLFLLLAGLAFSRRDL